ncbi:MAG: P-II family nitrogen regulator [Methylophaga sp.]|nr:P-II family nitrogen regulator [Methylophaga sp.]
MGFCKVTAIIQSTVLEKVEKALRTLNVPGISVTKVKGFGEYADFYKSDWMTSHVRIEIFILESQANEIADVIMREAHTGVEGDGIVAILPVMELFHIRTKEKF